MYIFLIGIATIVDNIPLTVLIIIAIIASIYAQYCDHNSDD